MKIKTVIERVFQKRSDGFWQEITNHLIKMTMPDNSVITKVDKRTVGKVFQEISFDIAGSAEGEALWVDKDSGRQIRLCMVKGQQY